MLTWILLAILAVNAATFISFWRDKVYAINGTRRIPEADLLKLALIGGTPSAFLARRMFRHKTRKEPFSTYLQLIAVIQLGGLIGFWLI